MKLDKNGILENTRFWKLGCNWGVGKPSFYDILIEENVVINHIDLDEYEMGSLVLVTEGFTVNAIAQVTSLPIPILSNKALRKKLVQKEVHGFKDIFYYSVDFLELKDDRFIYKLQKGIRRVHKLETKKIASKLWLGYKEDILVEFKFKPGVGRNQGNYNRKQKKQSKSVDPLHGKISSALLIYFRDVLQIAEKNLSFEKSRVGDGILDAAVKTDVGMEIYEIKTSSTAKENIREAMGQLIEYALYTENEIISKLIIVGPVAPNKIELMYLTRIRKAFKLPIEYWANSFNESKFDKYK